MDRKEVSKGFAWNVLFNFISKALFPLIGIVIARALGPTELGVYTTIATVVVLTEILRDAGLGITFIADPEAEKHEGAYVALASVFGLALALALFLSRGELADFFAMPGLTWGLSLAATAVALNGFATVPVNKLQKQARFRDAGLIDVLAGVGSYAVALPMVFSGFGFAALVWQLVIRSLLALVLYAAVAKISRPVWDLAAIRGILRKSSAALANNVLYAVYTLGDNALIAKLYGAREAGLYGVAYNLASKPLDFITYPLGRTLFVAFSKSSQDLERLANVFARSLAAVLLISVPIYGAFVLFARPIVVGLYSESFEGSVWPFAILSIYLFCRSFGNVAGNALFAIGKPAWNVFSWLAGYCVAGFGLATGWPGISFLEAITWISLGAIAVYVVNTAAALLILRPRFPDMARIGRAIVPGAATIFVMLGCHLLPVSMYASLALGLLTGGAVHASLVGMWIAGDWKACLSRSGWAKLWQSL